MKVGSHDMVYGDIMGVVGHVRGVPGYRDMHAVLRGDDMMEAWTESGNMQGSKTQGKTMCVRKMLQCGMKRI